MNNTALKIPRCPGCETEVVDGRHGVLTHAGEKWHADCFEVFVRNCVMHFTRHLFQPGHPRRLEHSKEFTDRVARQFLNLAYEERCAICGCTEDDACPPGCHWVDKSLCSSCMPPAEPKTTGVPGVRRERLLEGEWRSDEPVREFKTWRYYFDLIWGGGKDFEIRKLEEVVSSGQKILLIEHEMDSPSPGKLVSGKATGRKILALVVGAVASLELIDPNFAGYYGFGISPIERIEEES